MVRSLFSILVLTFTSSLGAQTTYQEIPSPVTGADPVLMGTSPDGRLWVVFRPPGVYQPVGTLAVQRILSVPGSLTPAGQVSSLGFSSKTALSGRVSQGTFYPQNDVSVFGESTPVSNKEIRIAAVQATAEPPSVKTLCSTYTVADGGKVPDFQWGIFPTEKKGELLFTGSSDGISTVYSLSGCVITPITKTSADVLTVGKLPGGKYLIERAPSVRSLTTEVLTLSASGTTTLVSTNADAKPQILAKACCDLVIDPVNQTGIVTFRSMDGFSKAVYVNKEGTLREIYSSQKDGLVSAQIRAIDIKGNWALIGGSPDNLYRMDKILRLNVLTGEVTVMASTGSQLPGIVPTFFFRDGAALTPDGGVYFAAGGANGLYKMFLARQAQAPIPVLDPFPSSVQTGWNVTVTGKNLTGTTLLVQGNPIKTEPASGGLTFVAPATPGTYSVQAKITFGGLDYFSNVVQLVVTSPPALPPAPKIDAITEVMTYARTQPETVYASGGWITLWGNNLGTTETAAIVVPFLPGSGGYSVRLTAASGGATYFGRLQRLGSDQVNLQLPYAPPGTYTLVFRNANYNQDSNPVAITLVAIKMNFPLYSKGKEDYLGFLHQDYTYVTPDKPPMVGEIVSIYATGLGPTNPEVPEGEAAVAPLVGIVEVKFNGQPAQVLYAGLQGQYPGLYQINALVPLTNEPVSEVEVIIETADGTRDLKTMRVEVANQ